MAVVVVDSKWRVGGRRWCRIIFEKAGLRQPIGEECGEGFSMSRILVWTSARDTSAPQEPDLVSPARHGTQYPHIEEAKAQS